MATDQNSSERLNKYLALQLGIARREADDLIVAGRVRLNDHTATLGARITDDDTVHVDGSPITRRAAYRYVLFHKPTNYVCSRKRQGESETIYALLPSEMHALKPVGRLDRDSSGILLLTNDGNFAHQMTHPSFHKTKVYEIILDHDLEPLHQQMIADYGVELEDGRSQFALQRLHDDDRREWQITMSEGRNRQIRRTFAALGYVVRALHRTHFGPYGLDDLPEGKWRKISP